MTAFARLLVIVLALLPITKVQAQQNEALVRLEFRISALGSNGTVIIDRGRVHKVAVNDHVTFLLRNGNEVRGRVAELDNRNAIVELNDRNQKMSVGTKGHIMIPGNRKPPVTKKPIKTQTPAPPKVADEHPPWKNQDPEYKQGMPLLALVKPIHPRDRGIQTSGHLYTALDLARTSGDGSSNTFLRAGVDTTIENPFGKGGGIRFEGEFDYRTEVNDELGVDLNLHEFSYYSGGNRFEAIRWEAGRFRQHGMPEFGILDGFEWGRRLENADRIGASIGFLPELDDDLDTVQDFQLSAYYLWAADNRERFTAGIGFQKTFHKGDSDRDLLVAKIRYLPPDSWDFHGTVWVDFFEGNDNIKGKGAEVSHALASLGRRWKSGNGINLTFRHNQFPELLRDDFIPLGPNGIDDSRYDRFSFSGWNWISSHHRFHGQTSIWNDEEESGGSLDMGLESKDLFLDRSTADITLYATAGKFSDGAGVRLSYGRYVETGRWDVFYEIGNRRFDTFPSDADDLIQHRFRASHSFRTAADWYFSVHTDATLWDEEFSWSVGFNMNKSF